MSKVVHKISLQEYLNRQENMGGNKRKRGPVPIANNDSDIQDSQTHIGVSKRPCLDMTNDFNVQYFNPNTEGPTTDNASPRPGRPLPPTSAPPPSVSFPPTTRESASPTSSAYTNMINVHVGGAPSQPHYRTFPVYSGLISYYSSHFATWLQMRSAQLDGLRLETDDPVVFEVFLGWLNDKKIVGPDAPTGGGLGVDGDGDKMTLGDEGSEIAYHHQPHYHYPDYHVQHGAQEEDKSTTLGFALLFKLHVFATKYEIPLFANEVINAALRTTIRFWSRPSSESVWSVYDNTDPASDVDAVSDGDWEGLMQGTGSLLRKFCVDVFCLTHTPFSATSTHAPPTNLPAAAAAYPAASALSGTDSTTTAPAPATTEQTYAGQCSQEHTRGRPLLPRAKACDYPNAFLLDCVNEFSTRLPVFTPPPPPPMASATPTLTPTQGPYSNSRSLGRKGLQNLDWCVWHVHPPGVRCREQVEKIERIRAEEEREWARLQEEKEREWFRVQEEERTRLQEEEGRRRQQRAWDPNFDYGGSSGGSGGGGGGRQYGGHEYGGRGGGQGREGGYGRDGGYNRGGQYRNREGGGERWNHRNSGGGSARDRRGGGNGCRSSQGGQEGVGRWVRQTW